VTIDPTPVLCDNLKMRVFGNVAPTFFAVLLVGAAFFAGLYLGNSERGASLGATSLFAESNVAQPVDADFAPLWKAWNELDTKFVPASSTAQITNDEKIWGAIEGLADAYGDPYTSFFPPVEATILEDDIAGSFGGVGIEIGVRDDILTVISPLKGGPAEQEGLLSGDQIVGVDGTSTIGMALDEAVSLIRGEIGTPVILQIRREGVAQAFDVSIVRDVISIPTIDFELTEDDIFVIELYNFNTNASDLFRESLREFIVRDTNKLILDLRGNPGGLLGAAQEISSWFLPAGKIVVQERAKEGITGALRSKGYDPFDDLQMVILIDGGSASAAEIVAGALSEHGVATLVGTQTFGKGSVQELVSITDDTRLKLTIGQWLTPNGISISDQGLTPDVEISITEEDRKEGRDPQFEKAVELLLAE